ncbi:PH and SEC7 domain-containing protein isoform X1 [Coccinella septempunctata]|uniref:PH and SEC7 domain-containing protein isoform X1 n=1 Tax=Coccinella septempunctata TaxID=41139 RepID=UPI001D081329|nr:PH and SEC7 domain-containing protein isoform X1 [Coccinella septempunctata]
MAEELLVVLKRSEQSGLGFSLLGQPGLPPIIYKITKDSPAAESGEVEVGDVILKVNEIDVNRLSTKEVLKCLRLSEDPVKLKIKRDPNIKASVQSRVLTKSDESESNCTSKNKKFSPNRPQPTVHQTHHLNKSIPEKEPLLMNHGDHDRLQWQPLSNQECVKKPQPKFEAYMMTGEKILNISKIPQSTSLAKHRRMANARYHNNHSSQMTHSMNNSVPNSPNESDLGQKAYGAASLTTSPECATRRLGDTTSNTNNSSGNYVRNSRSEDQLQGQNYDIDERSSNAEGNEDMTSSLNTLLDTASDNTNVSDDSDRIVWTYNAPISENAKHSHQLSNGSNSSHSNSSPTSLSPPHSESPASPTSVSSSVMSSHSGSRKLPYSLNNLPLHSVNDASMSEAISNISSPDYHDDDSMGIRDCIMEISDPSDSDSTLLVSEPYQRRRGSDNDHRIVIQVKGPDKSCFREKQIENNIPSQNGYEINCDLMEQNLVDYDSNCDIKRDSSPTLMEDDSDIESLHSFHYSPKAVDVPSAIRLAKRLYSLDGFKKSDVSRHLSKNNDFSKAVAEEYLKYFDFENDTLDAALRKFLKQFSLTGETQERERVLVHFSKRYLFCNPGSFNSQDAVHTLTCAIMLLNTDLHGQNINRKMTCNEFIENLADLNEGKNFPREVLKQIYHSIKNYPLEWALDECTSPAQNKVHEHIPYGVNPFLEVPTNMSAVEYKKGYVMRKCCFETNAKRSLCCVFLAPFHKRSWKMFYCTLRDLMLFLHKDENGFRKNEMSDNPHNAIRIHHALATRASDYIKKQYVFRLQTADQAEYLFQTSDSKELQSWIDTINFVCASFSAPPLEAAVGSQKKFQRPLLPSSLTKYNLREQLRDHEERVTRLEAELDEHRRCQPEKGSKSLVIQNYKEKENYLNYEVKRYRTYAYILRIRIGQYQEVTDLKENSIGELDEAMGVTLMDETSALVPPPIPDRMSPSTNRHSYRQAIYSRNTIHSESENG